MLFRLGMVARETAGKLVAIQTCISSMLAWPATITAAYMTAPAGYDLQPLGPELAALYPMPVRRCTGCLLVCILRPLLWLKTLLFECMNFLLT